MLGCTLHNHAILLVLARSLPRDLTVSACCRRRPAMTVSALPAPPGCTGLRRLCSGSLTLATAHWRRDIGCCLLLLLLL